MEVFAEKDTNDIKNSVTVTRIVANLVGIGMAMFMAAIPPRVYGGSPREAKFLLEDKKRAFRDCIELVLEGFGHDSILTNDDLRAKLHHLHAVAVATFLTEFLSKREL